MDANNINSVNSPHDAFFKRSMANPHIARDFFLAHLPKTLLDIIHLETLTLRKETFITPSLKSSMADLLYSVEFQHKTGFLYVIAEHQSSPDKLMPFRMIKYICQIMDQHLKDTGEKELPLVYPLIFYNGKVAYPYSTDFFELFGADQQLARDMIFNPIQLVDVGRIPDEEIKAQQWAGLMTWFMKHIRARNVLPYLIEVKDIFSRMSEEATFQDHVNSVIYYIVNAGEMPSEELFIESLKEALPKPFPEKVMTIAEMFIAKGEKTGILLGMQQGIEKGREEGREEGREKGREEERYALAKKILLLGSASIDFIAQVTGFSLEKIKEIQADVKNKAEKSNVLSS